MSSIVAKEIHKAIFAVASLPLWFVTQIEYVSGSGHFISIFIFIAVTAFCSFTKVINWQVGVTLLIVATAVVLVAQISWPDFLLLFFAGIAALLPSRRSLKEYWPLLVWLVSLAIGINFPIFKG